MDPNGWKLTYVRDTCDGNFAFPAWYAVVDEDLLWFHLAVQWQLAHRSHQRLDQGSIDGIDGNHGNHGNQQWRSWRAYVTYHDLLEQQFGYNLTGAPIDPLHLAIQPLRWAQPQLVRHPSSYVQTWHGPIHMNDGTSIHIGPDPVRPLRGRRRRAHTPIRVVDTLTHAILSTTYLTEDEENVALLDPRGYMAINR